MTTIRGLDSTKKKKKNPTNQVPKSNDWKCNLWKIYWCPTSIGPLRVETIPMFDMYKRKLKNFFNPTWLLIMLRRHYFDLDRKVEKNRIWPLIFFPHRMKFCKAYIYNSLKIILIKKKSLQIMTVIFSKWDNTIHLSWSLSRW